MHVIVGAGAVGSATARLLAESGEQVRLVSRRGLGPDHPAIERTAADATGVEALAGGAKVIYNCVNPQYHRWLTDWPPIAAALLTAAERTGAVLATTSNLYGYGPITAPITDDTPLAATHPKLKLRADMWRAALAAPVTVTEVRGGDYLEQNSIFTEALSKPLLAGKRAWAPANLDAPHTWTSIQDVARCLITVAADPRGHGRAWLVPSHPPMTLRTLATLFTEANNAPHPKLTAIPYPVLWTTGLFSPLLRELRTTNYQFARPFTMDSSSTERTFGLKPRDLTAALREAAG